MNKGLIVSIVIVLVLAGVGVYSYTESTNKNAELEEQAMMQKEQMEKEAMMKSETASSSDTMMKKDDAMKSAGTYEAYEPEKVAKAATGKVVLFFRAGWCPTCRAVDADIKAHLSDIPSGLTILDVNYDNEKELKKKYGVTYQHTFVQVDAQGNVIKKWSASPTLSSLVGQVK